MSSQRTHFPCGATKRTDFTYWSGRKRRGERGSYGERVSSFKASSSGQVAERAPGEKGCFPGKEATAAGQDFGDTSSFGRSQPTVPIPSLPYKGPCFCR